MSQGRYVLRIITQLITSRLIYRVLVGIAVLIGTNYLFNDRALADTFEVAVSATSIIFIASEVGMSMVLMRAAAQVTKDKLERYYGTALFIETMAWLGFMLVTTSIYASINGFNTMFWLLIILGTGQAIIQYRVIFRSIYRSLHRGELITFIEVLDGLSKVAGMWLITHYIADRTIGVYWISIMFTLTTILFIGIYGLNTFKLVRPRFASSLISDMTQEGFWFSAQTLIMTIYFEIDKLIMRFYQLTGWAELPAGDITRYGAASRIIVFFLVFHRIGLQVITPYLYAAFPKNMPGYRRIVQWSTRYMSACGIGLGIGITIMADDIMHLLYREELWNATPALQIFGVFLAVRFIGITSSQVFATTGQQPLRTKQEFMGVILNIILDLILIPFFGFLGGAIATLITELVIQTIFFVMARRIIQDSVWLTFKQIIPALLAGIIMGILVYIIKPYLPIYVTPFIGAGLFALLLFTFKFFNKADLKLCTPSLH
ncbi:MAG: polysaccharide biosynthesis C-terminal domain-containing protein [Patescibacteria group bacterium]|jgi:O-antigen/teichoic acid export membrane protein